MTQLGRNTEVNLTWVFIWVWCSVFLSSRKMQFCGIVVFVDVNNVNPKEIESLFMLCSFFGDQQSSVTAHVLDTLDLHIWLLLQLRQSNWYFCLDKIIFTQGPPTHTTCHDPCCFWNISQILLHFTFFISKCITSIFCQKTSAMSSFSIPRRWLHFRVFLLSQRWFYLSPPRSIFYSTTHNFHPWSLSKTESEAASVCHVLKMLTTSICLGRNYATPGLTVQYNLCKLHKPVFSHYPFTADNCMYSVEHIPQQSQQSLLIQSSCSKFTTLLEICPINIQELLSGN